MLHCPVIIKARSGFVVRRSENLGALAHYSKHKADLVEFETTPFRLVHGKIEADVYKTRFRFSDGATTELVHADWRPLISLLARGARRANGPFPATLAPAAGTLAPVAARFYEMRDMKKAAR